ncbi:MAG: cytochrome c maturation protein CcmE [Paracoccaceae bacterium]
MALSKKAKRIRMLVLGGVAMVTASVLVVLVFNDTIAFFKSPSEIAAAPPAPGQLIRLGGLVEEGSVERGTGEVVRFAVTDGGATVPVRFAGVLPDLFSEGRGIVAEGRMEGDVFIASEVLAKHDENYMPREVADALREQGHWQDGVEP